MTSKFKNKLKRLHQSRVRALETIDSDNSTPRVFHAAPEETVVSSPNSTAKPAPKTRSVAPTKDFSGLKRAIVLEEKSGSRTKKSAPTQTGAIVHTSSAAGDRVKTLRKKLETIAPEDSASLLFEMVAIQPDNTFALSRIVQYYRSAGESELAALFAKRLKEHSPF